MSICFEKARELAELILNSKEAERLKLAKEKLIGDRNITRMIDEFDAYREMIAADIEKGELTKAEEDLRAKELRNKYALIENEPLFSAKKQAEADYESLVDSVMDILNMTLGRSTDKCSGCSGCGMNKKG